jgi:hypothetical protein
MRISAAVDRSHANGLGGIVGKLAGILVAIEATILALTPTKRRITYTLSGAHIGTALCINMDGGRPRPGLASKRVSYSDEMRRDHTAGTTDVMETA